MACIFMSMIYCKIMRSVLNNSLVVIVNIELEHILGHAAQRIAPVIRKI